MMPNTEVEFIVDDGDVRIVKASTGRHPSRGARAVARLHERGGGVRMTTDEIMALTRGDA